MDKAQMVSLCLVAEGFSAESDPGSVVTYVTNVTGIQVQQIAQRDATTDDKSKWIIRFSSTEGEAIVFFLHGKDA